MFTTVWLAEFSPADHGWHTLGTTPQPWSQWSRTVEGQQRPDVLTLLPAPESKPGVVVTLALNGGGTDCPDGWSRDDLIAHIS
jgi:hypothetical protein